MPVSRREGEESYPNSPQAPRSADGSADGSDGVIENRGYSGNSGGGGGSHQPDGVHPPLGMDKADAVALKQAAAVGAGGPGTDAQEGFEDARDALHSGRATTSAGGFGSAQSSVSGRRSGPSVSDAEDVSIGESEVKALPFASTTCASERWQEDACWPFSQAAGVLLHAM